MKIKLLELKALVSERAADLRPMLDGAHIQVGPFDVHFRPKIKPPIAVYHDDELVHEVLDDKGLSATAVKRLEGSLSDEWQKAISPVPGHPPRNP